jgi:hypothetical protein
MDKCTGTMAVFIKDNGKTESSMVKAKYTFPGKALKKVYSNKMSW